jgi:hypothetical protein
MLDHIKEIKKFGLKAIGKKEICAHFNGAHLTRGEAILAKCYDCMCYYADGRLDCNLTACPLYSFMPYRKNSRNDV